MTTAATPDAANRDLILGVTNDSQAIFSPGLVAMSKSITPDTHVTFTPADLFGTWRVYLQRVEAKSTGSTIQIGQTSFGPTGAFVTGTLTDPGPPTVGTLFTTGSASINANGSVSGTFVAGTGTTANRYGILGSMRAAKDLITGVLTANLSASGTTHYGVVTMVRDITVLNMGQAAYTVTEGQKLTATVVRTGNMAGTVSASYAATGATGSLVPPFAGTLSFPSGTASQTITLTTAANTVVDGNRSVTLTLSNTSVNTVLGPAPSASVNIVDEDRAGTVKLSATTYSVMESARTVPIVIQRTGTNLASNVVVQFTLTSGTAVDGIDYLVPANTSASFAAGATSLTVPVTILENTRVDGPRSFTFSLSSISPPSGTIGTPASATVTIGDNDLGGTLQFSTPTYSVAEGNTSTVTVMRSGGAAGGVLVDFTTGDGTARAGQNYAANSGTLTFNSTNTSQTFQVATINDALITGDNTVLLTLSNARSSTGFTGTGAPVLGAIKNAVLTIHDAQKGVQFTSSNYSASETTAAATINVIRTGPLTDTATVRYSTSDGTGVGGVNYAPTSGVLTFAPSASAQSFQVKLMQDKVAGGPKTVLLLLSGANSSAAPPVALGPRNSAVLTIGDVDVAGSVKVGTPAVSVTTTAGAAVVSLTRSGGTAGGVSVDYATCDASTNPLCPGTAHAGIDYQPTAGTVTFGPGETTKTVQVVISSDPTVKLNRTFTLSIGNPQGGATVGTPAAATVTIGDAVQGGVVQLGATAFAATEPLSGNVSATITLKRTGTSLADGASVIVLTGTGSATPSVNYTPLATTIVFNGNETTKTVPLTVLADGGSVGNGNLNVPVSLTGAGGGATLGTPATGMVTIMRANRSFQFSAPAPTVVEGGTAAITVLRGGPPAGTASVQWLAVGDSGTAVTDFKPSHGTLSFATNATSATFTIATLATVPTSTNRSITLTLGNASAGYTTGLPAVLTVQDKDGPGTFQFAAGAYSVTEGGAPVTVTVNRTGGQGGTVLVPWTSNVSAATDFTPVSGTLTFGPGITTKTFTVSAVNNTVLDGTRPFLLSLNASAVSVGAQGTATLSVLDNDTGGAIQFTSATQTVAETVPGGIVNLGLTRGTGTSLAGGVQVDYTIAGDTGGISSPLNGSATFTAGLATASIPVSVVNGAAAQADRVLTVTLSNPRSGNGYTGPGAPTLGTQTALTLTIIDALPHVQFSAANFSVVEGGTATIGVVRTGPGSGAVTVQYATVAGGTAVSGTDYTPASGTLTGTAGAAKTFTIPTVDDGVLAGNRTVMLTLSNAAGGSLGTLSAATLTIVERESAGTLQFATASSVVLEGGTAHVTVRRNGANLVGGVTVGWSVTGGSASPATDFSPSSGTLTFDAGVTSQGFDVVTTDNGVATGTQTIVLGLAAPTGGAVAGNPSATTIFILDHDQSVGFASPAVSVGETTPTASVQVVRSGVPNGPVTVQFDTIDGTAVHDLDYRTTSTLLTFGPGDIVKTVSIPIVTANAATRNGNRALGLVLSNPSSNAALNAANVSTLTILDFRPDLVIASVSAPSGTLSGKSVAAPSTVRNIGPVAAPAFQIGIFMVRADAPDAQSPGAGSLVATQSVTGLAPGASATFPTQFTIDDGFPAGDYYLSAVANFGLTVAEADSTNDGRSSAPQSFKVSNNLTKFKSASASFSQTSPPAPTGPGISVPMDTCNAQGNVVLTGTFQINSQQNNTAQGQASLTGTLNDQPVQYLIAFTGTGDDSGNITATLTSILFRSLTPPLFTGSGNGSLTGSLQGRTLVATVSGQFTGDSVGTCVFTGSLAAQAQTSFQFRTGAGRDDAGSFGFPPASIGTGFNQSASVSFPLFPQGGGAELRVFFDSNYPDPGTVLFTGPAGSGFTNQPADPSDSSISDNEAHYRVGHNTGGSFPGGKWSVLYKGVAQSFTLPPFNANASWVVILPTANVDVDGNLTSVSWQYLRPNGSTLTTAPSSMAAVSVQVRLNNGGNEPESALLSPATTTFDIVGAGFSPPEWNKVQSIRMQYSDITGNVYEQQYGKEFSVQIMSQIEHNYIGYIPGCNTSAGCISRQANVFVNVPTNSINRANCADGPPVPPIQPATPPFFVQIQNHDADPAFPFSSPTCVGYTGTTSFNNIGVMTDIFSTIVDLDSQVPPVTLPVGTQFDISVGTDASNASISRQMVLTSVEVPEPAAGDAISIPNPATPLLKPSGFMIPDAKLGSAQTISWTQPAFTATQLYVSPIVYTSATGQGSFCSVQSGNLDVNATQTSFTLPRTCNGQAVQQANVCVVYTGDQGQQSSACWFWSTLAMSTTPDLVMTTVSGPPSATIGGVIDVIGTVLNQGTADASSFNVGYFLSTTNTPGTGTLIGRVFVLSLAAGTSTPVNASLMVPAGTPGSYFVTAVADVDGILGEASETNNGLAAPTPTAIGP